MANEKEFGIWTLTATVGAVRIAQDNHFQPAHYDAVEWECKRNGGVQITGHDVDTIVNQIKFNICAICQQCGRFHTPPACEAK